MPGREHTYAEIPPPEKKLPYLKLSPAERAGLPRRPVARGRSDATVNADIDFSAQNPRRSRHISIADFPPPPADIYAKVLPKIGPAIPPRIPQRSSDDFLQPPPEVIDKHTYQTSEGPGRYPRLRPPSIVPPKAPVVPPRNYTFVYYPDTPAQKPPQTKSRDPACNVEGLSDERDLKLIDPVQLRQNAMNKPVVPDPAFSYDKIYSLTKENIDLFLNCRDVAMILFYNPEDLSMRTGLKKRYVNAARVTGRYNHAFAAVNCQQERALCDAYNITKTPVFSVFTVKSLVGSFRDAATDPDILKRYVENVPLIQNR